MMRSKSTTSGIILDEAFTTDLWPLGCTWTPPGSSPFLRFGSSGERQKNSPALRSLNANCTPPVWAMRRNIMPFLFLNSLRLHLPATAGNLPARCRSCFSLISFADLLFLPGQQYPTEAIRGRLAARPPTLHTGQVNERVEYAPVLIPNGFFFVRFDLDLRFRTRRLLLFAALRSLGAAITALVRVGAALLRPG